jgi:hypothetical protein
MARYKAKLKAVTKERSIHRRRYSRTRPTAIQQELEDMTTTKNIPNSENFGALLWR